MVKNLPESAGDTGSIPNSEGYPGGENGNLLQYSCLENSMDRGDWWDTVHKVTKNWTQVSKQLSACARVCMHTHTHTHTHTKKDVPLVYPYFANQ